MAVKKLRLAIGLSVALLVCLLLVVVVIMRWENSDTTKLVLINVVFKEKQDIDWVRTGLLSIKGSDGRPKYADASVQTVVDPTADSAIVVIGTRECKTFQIRIFQGDTEEIQKDVQELYGNKISDINIRTYPP